MMYIVIDIKENGGENEICIISLGRYAFHTFFFSGFSRWSFE